VKDAPSGTVGGLSTLFPSSPLGIGSFDVPGAHANQSIVGQAWTVGPRRIYRQFLWRCVM